MDIRSAISSFNQAVSDVATQVKTLTASHASLRQKVTNAFQSALTLLENARGAKPNIQSKISDRTTLTEFNSLKELDEAIKSAVHEAVGLEKSATAENAPVATAQAAMKAKGRLQELRAIKEYYLNALQSQISLESKQQLSDTALLKVVTASVMSGIVSFNNCKEPSDELSGSFGMAKMVSLSDQGHDVRVLVESNYKGSLVIRKILNELGAGAEGVVSRTEQLEAKRTQEVVKEPRNETESGQVSGIRREANLTAKAKNKEAVLRVRNLMGGGEVTISALKTGGDIAKACAARRAAVLLLDLSVDQLNAPHSSQSWQLTNERLTQLVDRLTLAVVSSAKGGSGDQLLYELGGDLGQQLLKNESFQAFANVTTRFGWKALLEKHGANEEMAKGELREILSSSLKEMCAKLEKSHETFDRNELFSTIKSELQTSHNNSVIHRDIKPANILHARNGQVGSAPTLADFGMAVDLDEMRKKASIFHECNFPIGNMRDRIQVLNDLEHIAEGQSINPEVADRLVNAGVLSKTATPPGYTVIDQDKLQTLTSHLTYITEEQDSFVPPGTTYYSFGPYLDAASEYFKRGGDKNFESYSNLLKAADEIAAALTYYQLVTGQNPQVETVGGRSRVRLSDSDLAEIASNLEKIGEPSERIDGILKMLTPSPQIDVDALQNIALGQELPVFKRG